MTGDGTHRALLADQAASLAAELDASPYGVLEDYPEECYPIDVFCAVACIRRSDALTGLDHGPFVERAIRAFDGDMLDPRGLLPYSVDAQTGVQFEPSRGVGNSYFLIFAPALWPDRAPGWYARYERYFWQKTWWASGFREFPNDLAGYNWTYDVDAGPIIAGYSPGANAFAVAASKIHGRFDHHFTLAAQVMVACWPLADGTLLGCRFLSNLAHAPYLGESCLLYFLTQQPAPGVEIRTGGNVPLFAWLGILLALLFPVAIVIGLWRDWRRWKQQRPGRVIPLERGQFGTWLVLVLTGMVWVAVGLGRWGLVLWLVACLLPRSGRQPALTREEKG